MRVCGYSDVTPASGRPWVSVHQENQPYVRLSISPRVSGSPIFVMGRFLSTLEPVYPIWVLCHVHCDRKFLLCVFFLGGGTSQVPEKGSAPPLSTELWFPRMGFPFSRPTHPQLLPPPASASHSLPQGNPAQLHGNYLRHHTSAWRREHGRNAYREM